MTVKEQAAPAVGGGAYGLFAIGTLVYFWQQANDFWEYVLAVIQGLFWPAFLIFDLFGHINS